MFTSTSVSVHGFRACSYDPACRDGVFHPPCRDEILLLALAKRVHFSHATQLFSDFGVFLYLFARTSIALAIYLTLLYSSYQHKAR